MRHCSAASALCLVEKLPALACTAASCTTFLPAAELKRPSRSRRNTCMTARAPLTSVTQIGLTRDVLQNENCNFRQGPGTRCEKNGACSRISTRKFVWTAFFANKFFVSRSDFREVNPVVQLVQNGGSVGSFLSTGFVSLFFFFFLHRDLDFGDVQLINVWSLVSGMQDGFLNLVQQ